MSYKWAIFGIYKLTQMGQPKGMGVNLSKCLSFNAVVVFNLTKPGNISKAIKGERVGTLIGGTSNSTVART